MGFAEIVLFSIAIGLAAEANKRAKENHWELLSRLEDIESEARAAEFEDDGQW